MCLQGLGGARGYKEGIASNRYICDQLCVCSGAQGDIIMELHQTGKYTLYVYMGGDERY